MCDPPNIEDKTGSERGKEITLKGDENFADKPPNTHAEHLAEMMERDYSARLQSRELMGKWLLGLLICQNIGLAWVVWNFRIIGLDNIGLSAIVASTLGETAAVVHTMVKFLFREIPYHDRVY